MTEAPFRATPYHAGPPLCAPARRATSAHHQRAQRTTGDQRTTPVAVAR
ncbi:hypothetical protein [Oerskovia turbata]